MREVWSNKANKKAGRVLLCRLYQYAVHRFPSQFLSLCAKGMLLVVGWRVLIGAWRGLAGLAGVNRSMTEVGGGLAGVDRSLAGVSGVGGC